jgi:hypothetical protein
VGDHVCVWYYGLWFTGDVKVTRGWYGGKASQTIKTRPKVRSNVDVCFPEDDGGSSV